MKSKYKFFPIMMLILVIVHALLPCPNTLHSTPTLLNDFDFTGWTTIFLIIFEILNISILLFCIQQGNKVSEQGYPYQYNSILAVLFLMLAILSAFSFVAVRNHEETTAIEYYKTVQPYPDETAFKENSLQAVTKSLENLHDENFHSRKMQIATNSLKRPKLQTYAELFLYWIFHRHLAFDDEECYYAVFSGFTALDAISFVFYLTCTADEKKLENADIYYHQ